MFNRGEQRGAALITTLLATAMLLVIGAIASEQAVVSFLIGHRMRESAEASVAAETAMAVVLADFAARPTFEHLENAVGAGFPFAASAPRLEPMPASFSVDTEIRSRSSTQLDIIVTAVGRNNARSIIAATVERAGRPYVPAALVLSTAAPSLSFTGAFAIGGTAGAPAAVPALATPRTTRPPPSSNSSPWRARPFTVPSPLRRGPGSTTW